MTTHEIAYLLGGILIGTMLATVLWWLFTVFILEKIKIGSIRHDPEWDRE